MYSPARPPPPVITVPPAWRSAVLVDAPRSTILTRADSTTRNRRKALALSRAYDELEARIAHLAEQEELASVRPDLDGSAIMAALGIEPGPLVGRADAEQELLRWWKDQPEAAGSA